jgi:hypothetical protein
LILYGNNGSYVSDGGNVEHVGDKALKHTLGATAVAVNRTFVGHGGAQGQRLVLSVGGKDELCWGRMTKALYELLHFLQRGISM